MNQGAVIREIRRLAGRIDGIKAAYSTADNDAYRIPDDINQWPIAVVEPGPTLEYILSPGQQRHTYEVTVLVLTGGADIGHRAAEMAPMPDRVISKLVGNVSLGGLCNSCLFARSSGVQAFPDWGDCMGYEFTLRVSEQGSATPATGE